MRCDRDWYAPYEIRFTQWQIIWILTVLYLLKAGNWPPGDPNDIYIQHCLQSGGYFESAVLVAAEVEVRLDRTGDDGFIVRDKYCHNEDDRTLSRKYHLSEAEIEMRIRRVLRYVAGDARKRISYEEWVRNGWKEKVIIGKEV